MEQAISRILFALQHTTLYPLNTDSPFTGPTSPWQPSFYFISIRFLVFLFVLFCFFVLFFGGFFCFYGKVTINVFEHGSFIFQLNSFLGQFVKGWEHCIYLKAIGTFLP